MIQSVIQEAERKMRLTLPLDWDWMVEPDGWVTGYSPSRRLTFMTKIPQFFTHHERDKLLDKYKPKQICRACHGTV